MDRAFTQELMEKTGFPAEARQAFTQAEEQLLSAGQEAALDGAVEFIQRFLERIGSIKSL